MKKPRFINPQIRRNISFALIALVMCIFSVSSASSVIVADAGTDTSICPGEYIVLGGNPTASGGQQPYSYSWLVDGQPIGPYELDQYQETSSALPNQTNFFQTFKPGISGELRRVDVYVNTATPAILRVLVGDPFIPGSILIHEQEFELQANTWTEIEITCPPPLIAGQTYTLRFLSQGPTVFIPMSQNNNYPHGRSSWTPQTDLMFRTHMGPVTGLCLEDNFPGPNPGARPSVTTTYTVIVEDGLGATASDNVTVTVNEIDCIRLEQITFDPAGPYTAGEDADVGVSLSGPAPSSGLSFTIQGNGGFEDFVINVPEGNSTASQPVVMQTLGEFTATAQGIGFGGIINQDYQVYPLVQQVELSPEGPYELGQNIDVTVTLREAAIAGGAVIDVSSQGFLPVAVSFDEGEITATETASINAVGTGFTATATANMRAVGEAVSGPFNILDRFIYVNQATGSDETGDGSEDFPYATITNAIEESPAGVTVRIAPGTYEENLLIVDNLKLEGEHPATTIIDGTNSGKVISVPVASVNLEITRLSIVNGTATGISQEGAGAGVFFDGSSLTITDSQIMDNHSSSSGGGLWAGYESIVRLERSTFSGNEAGNFGGGVTSYSPDMEIINCTFSGNTAALAGGLYVISQAQITSTTIVENTATFQTGGIFASGSVSFRNTLMAKNQDTINHPDFYGSFNSQGYNIIGEIDLQSIAISGDQTGNIYNTEVLIGPLEDNGGYTLTHALLPGSPAVNSAHPAQFPPTDQRGVARPYIPPTLPDPRADIGAFEYEGHPVVATPASSHPSGDYIANQTVELISYTPNAQVYFTQDGSDPTQDSQLYTEPIIIDHSQTVKARAYREHWTTSDILTLELNLSAGAPAISPIQDTYNNDVTVSLTSSTPGVDIYYTLDGTEPTENSLFYEEPFLVSQSKRVIARAFKAGINPSNTSRHYFHLVVSDVTLSPPPGPFTQAQTVTLSTITQDAVIHYTLDGSDPDSGSPQYIAPIDVEGTLTLKAIAYKPGYTTSAVTGGQYRLPEIVHVHPQGDDSNDGFSWQSAKQTLQGALESASIDDEIWVAAGTYTPTNDTDREIAFDLVNHTAIYGGFAGWETQRSQRDWRQNKTILSGFLDAETQSYNIARAQGVTVTLDGLIFSGGRADGSEPFNGGGALHSSGSNLTIVNCTFENNSSELYGGALYLSGGNTNIQQSRFSFNESWGGGAVYMINNNTLVVINSLFEGNTATEGGAINNSSFNLTARNCTFTKNHAHITGRVTMTRNSFTRIFNSIMWGNTGVGSVMGIATPVNNGSIWNVTQDGFGQNSILADPLFVNPDARDYRLQSGSPAIDFPPNEFSLGDFDLDGKPRIINGQVDAGAYEFSPPVTSADEVKLNADITPLLLSDVSVTRTYGTDVFYVQPESHYQGLRVYLPGHNAEAGDRIELQGILRTNPAGERYVDAGSFTKTGKHYIRPVGVSVKNIGGGNWQYDSSTGAGQVGIFGGTGLNNVGLLVRVWGRVSAVSVGGIFAVDDGSGSQLWVEAQSDVVTPQYGTQVEVTGVVSLYRTGNQIHPRLLLASQGDLLPGPGKALKFDGQSSYVQVGDSEDLIFTSVLTLEAWVHPTGIGDPVNGGTILSREGEYILARFPDGTLRYSLATVIPSWGWVNTGIDLPYNTWMHVALVFNSESSITRIYINGAEAFSNVTIGTVSDYFPSMNDFRIGARQGYDQNFEGIIDEVRVWKAALAPRAISNNFMHRLTGFENNLSGYWRLDEGGGLTAGDRSPNANHGTLINGPLWVDSSASIID